MKIVLQICAASLAMLNFVANADDWPRWRGPDANGVSKETGWAAKWPADGPKQLWKAKVHTGFASVSVANGHVYALGNANDTDIVSCLDATTGKEIWRHSYPCKLEASQYEGGPNATPIVDGDRVYTFSRRAEVYCLDAAKGTVIWSRKVGDELKAATPQWGFAGSPLIVDDLCILNVGAAGVALDKKTGKVVWSSGTDAAGYATPVLFDASVLIFAKDSLIAINPKDGKQVWSYPWKTEWDVNAADPVIIGKMIFISCGYNHGGALLDLSGGKPKLVWENKNMRNHFNSSVLWGSNLYGVDESQLRCIALDNGSVKWTDKSSGKGSLIIASGKLIVLSERGELIVAPATPAEFKPVSRAQVLSGKCWTSPVLANGKIYCRNATGDLVCLDVAGKPTP